MFSGREHLLLSGLLAHIHTGRTELGSDVSICDSLAAAVGGSHNQCVCVCVCTRCKLWVGMMGLCECVRSLSAKVFRHWNHILVLLNPVSTLSATRPHFSCLTLSSILLSSHISIQRSTIGNIASRRWRTSYGASPRTTTRSSNMSSATWTSEWLRQPATSMLTTPHDHPEICQ